MIRTALLVIGAREGTLDLVRGHLDPARFILIGSESVPEAQAIVRARLRLLTDADGIDLLLTFGGIGLGVRDRVPEATHEAIDRAVPGLAEAMRAAAPEGPLTRGVVGIRRATLIANLPSGPTLLEPMLGALAPHLPAAVAALTPSAR